MRLTPPDDRLKWLQSHQRQFMKSLIVISLLAFVFSPSRANAANLPERTSYTYKMVGELPIKAEVYQYPDKKKRPVVVWLHGGALINGNRAGISSVVRNFAFSNDCVLVSFDYRLAPESRLPQIIEDVEDAFKWLRADGPRLFGADPDRIAVTGGSAGGYLTLATGHRVKPRPQVLLAFWGYGDLVGDWYSKPSPHPRHNQRKVERDEAFEQVKGPPVSDSRERKGNGGLFYIYCRQTGLWPKLVSGWDPMTEARRFDPFMPVKNVTSDYPPTVMIHGTDDTDVPHEQSVMMAREFKKHNVPHLFFAIANGEHGLGGADRDEINRANTKGLEFLKTHLLK